MSDSDRYGSYSLRDGEEQEDESMSHAERNAAMIESLRAELEDESDE